MLQTCFLILSQRSLPVLAATISKLSCVSQCIYSTCQYLSLRHTRNVNILWGTIIKTACVCVITKCRLFLAPCVRLACQWSWHWSGWRWQAHCALKLSHLHRWLLSTWKLRTKWSLVAFFISCRFLIEQGFFDFSCMFTCVLFYNKYVPQEKKKQQKTLGLL